MLDPKQVEKELRPYQLMAVGKMVNYIRNFNPETPVKSALVGMPTGSGKTIIIASLARCLPLNGCVLVLSPRRPIVDQLFDEISDKIFNEKFKQLVLKPTKPVFNNEPEKLDFKNELVICWTIQKLNTVFKEGKELYANLKENVSLILFDEGHYEPALQWSKAVRSFKVPRIIFTATPFRNDFKKFDIDWENNVYKENYIDLRDKNYLRDVEIKDLGSRTNINMAIEDALIQFDTQKLKHPEARLIIKCDSSESIIAISKYLMDVKRKFISIHETFTTSFRDKNEELGKYLTKSVPLEQDKCDKEIWVHQFKLIEGIDSAKFRCLAIMDKMSSTRSLVQQIGRIIRNPSGKKDLAYVFNYTEENYNEVWSGFKHIDKFGKITQTLAEQVFDEISENLSQYQYVDKKIRTKLTASEFKSWNLDQLKENLQLPLKVNLIQKFKGFDHKKFVVEFLDKNFKDKEHKFFKNIYGKKSGLYLYFKIQNSPFLKDTFFPEITHNICFFKEKKDFLIFFDSGRLLPLGQGKHKLGYGLKPEKLRSIFKQTEDTKINRVALKSSNIGTLEPNSHSYIAQSIEDTTGYLNDFSHFLSSAFGYYLDKKVYRDYKDPKHKENEYQIPTYIGFGTGRISQNEGKYVKFKEYLDWIDYLCDSLENAGSYSNVFNRYSTEISNKTDSVPQSILLDLFDFENTHKIKVGLKYLEDEDENRLSIVDTFHIVKKNSKTGEYGFNISIGNQKYPIKVEYDSSRNRFKLQSYEVSGEVEAEVLSENQKVSSLIKSINLKQCFRILTNNGLSYSGGRFYEPHFKFGNAFDSSFSPIPNMLISIDELSKRFSEKGTKNGTTKKDSWQDNSIFALIDDRGKGSQLKDIMLEKGEKEELLICTDLNTEPADFIWVTNKKIAFIHVKGKGNKDNPSHSQYGASPISEICNQAVKNVHLLSIFDNSPPGNFKTWSTAWNPNSKQEYVVKKRIRTTNLTKEIDPDNPDSIWNFILKKKMNVNISKEVWLVMGYTMKRKIFLDKISSKKPPPEAKQAALTLESTLANVHSLGAKLKIFCS